MRDLLDASSYHLTECKFRNLSPTTIEQYQYYETAFCTWLTEAGHGLALHQLNAPNVRECTLWLKERHAATAKRGGQFTAHFFVGAMKTWSRFLVYEDILEADFLAKLTRPKLVKVARIPFELHDIQAIRGALYQNSMGRRDVAMLALMLDTGVRIGELVGLELRDLDAASCRVLVRGKGNKERLLPFGGGERNGGKTGALLRDYLKARRAKPGVVRLFVNHKGDPLTADGWRDVFQDACRAAGVKDPQPHRVRHAQPLYAPVLTPTGWVRIGDITPGDQVIGVNGQPTIVKGVYPKGVQEIVRIRFSDGATAECTLDHLWTVRPSLSKCWPRNADHYRTLSTREIMASEGPWHTPVAQPVEFDQAEPLPVEPYTLGALLGDGHLGRNIVLASAVGETEVVRMIEARLPAGMVVTGVPGRYTFVGTPVARSATHEPGSAVTLGQRRPDLDNAAIADLYRGGRTTVELAAMFETTHRTITKRLRQTAVEIRRSVPRENPLLDVLRSMGLVGQRGLTKAIPALYMRASVEARTELLRGLMDTDGYASARGHATFTTISPRLAADMVELVRSLGGIAQLRVRRPYATAKHDAYRVMIRTPFNPFHMGRKRERYDQERSMHYELVRTIKSIEPAGTTECLCIEVAAPDGLYVTQDYVVTHNTFATRYLVRSPGDVEGLRYMLGHLDDDMYREYSGLAGQIIAQQAGRESLVEVWFAETPTPRKPADRPANVTPLPASRGRHEPERRQRQHHHGRSRQRLVRLLLGVPR